MFADFTDRTWLWAAAGFYFAGFALGLSMVTAGLLSSMFHLGHPERSFSMYLTPHRESAMAMFGFVYLWYLMAVLVLEIWFDYRQDLVRTWQASTGLKRQLYGALTLWSADTNWELATARSEMVWPSGAAAHAAGADATPKARPNAATARGYPRTRRASVGKVRLIRRLLALGRQTNSSLAASLSL